MKLLKHIIGIAFLAVLGLPVCKLIADSSVSSTFDLSEVIPISIHAKVIEKRLRSGLVPALLGDPANSLVRLTLYPVFSKGQLICEIYVSYGSERMKLIAHPRVSSLMELSHLANRLISSGRLWACRVEKPQGQGWLVRPIVPSAPAPYWATALSRGGVWQVNRASVVNKDGLVKMRLITGNPPSPGDFIVPLLLKPSSVKLRVVGTNNTPLSDIQVYTNASKWPDPLKLKDSKLVGTTGATGETTFKWSASTAAHLLFVRDGVPLETTLIVPTQPFMEVTVRIPSRWNHDGKTLTLDQYVLAKRQEFAKLRAQREKKRQAFASVKALFDKGKWDEALAALDALDSSDPTVRDLKQRIVDTKRQVVAEEWLRSADVAEAESDFDRAIMCLKKAMAISKAGKKQEIAKKLKHMETQARKVRQQTAEAKDLLFSRLPDLQAKKIVDEMVAIEAAVMTLISTRQISSLSKAAEQLKKSIDALNTAINLRLDDMERRQVQIDSMYEQLKYARSRLHHQLELIHQSIKK